MKERQTSEFVLGFFLSVTEPKLARSPKCAKLRRHSNYLQVPMNLFVKKTVALRIDCTASNIPNLATRSKYVAKKSPCSDVWQLTSADMSAGAVCESWSRSGLWALLLSQLRPDDDDQRHPGGPRLGFKVQGAMKHHGER